MLAVEDKESVVESFSLTLGLRKGRRREIVKLLVNENRSLSWPLNSCNGPVWSPFLTHIINMRCGVSR